MQVGGRGGAGRLVASAGLLVILALLLAGFGAVQAAAAADVGPQTVTFTCEGFPQEFDVPPGVRQISVTAQGAAGGSDAGGFASVSSHT
jgi:hypothetical protein